MSNLSASPSSSPGGVADFSNRNQQVVAISPDGRLVAMIADDQIWLRELGELEATPLRNTSDPRSPTFSPDSRQLAYWDNNQIKRIEVSGGAAVVVGDLGPRPMGVSWADDGFIYAGDNNGRVIWRLPETGGEPEQVVELTDEGGQAYGPRLIPGAEWLLFTLSQGRAWNSAQIVAQSLLTEERRVLVEGGHDARFSPTGHLTYVTGGVLLARTFEPSSLAVGAGAVPILQGVRTSGGNVTGAAYYGFADNGSLVHVRGLEGRAEAVSLAWFERDGTRTALPLDTGAFRFDAALSPDGRFVAVTLSEGEGDRVWVYAVDRPGGQRLSSNDTQDPVWSPDGEWVYFSKTVEEGDRDIWRRRADLSTPEEPVLAAAGVQWPEDVSQDGEWLYYNTFNESAPDIGRVSLSSEAEPEMVVVSEAALIGGSVSPDGLFIAFISNENGRFEAFVVEIASGRRWRISPGGAGEPAWSPQGDEIFYRTPTATYSVAVTTGSRLPRRGPTAVVPEHRLVEIQSRGHTRRPALPLPDTGEPGPNRELLTARRRGAQLVRRAEGARPDRALTRRLDSGGNQAGATSFSGSSSA